MIKEEDLVIRIATMEDAVPATQLLTALGLIMPDDKQVHAHWERLWPGNPYYKLFNEDVHIGWVLEYHGKIVGFFGSFPRIYFLDGKPFPLAIPSQWGVEKEFRSFTALLSDRFFNENPIKTKLVTTAIKPTGRIFEKYKGNRVPSPDLTSVYMIPLKIDKLIGLRLTSKIKQQSLIKAIAGLLQLAAWPWHLHYAFIKQSVYISEMKVDALSTDFEEFWQAYLKKTSGLIASRNTETIKWFYKGGFRKLENRLFMYKRENTIQGYISVLNEPVKDSNLNRYKIVDLIALSDEVKKELMNYCIRFCYEKGADVLEIHLPGLLSKRDIPVLSLSRNVAVWPFYYHASDHEINEILLKHENWHTSPYDGDVCLF